MATIDDYKSKADEVAREWGIPQSLFRSLLESESSWNPRAYNPISGATGIAQFLPSTAKQYGVDPYNANSSIEGAGHYLADIARDITGGTQSPSVDQWLQAIGTYKGKSGDAQTKIDYAKTHLGGWTPSADDNFNDGSENQDGGGDWTTSLSSILNTVKTFFSSPSSFLVLALGFLFLIFGVWKLINGDSTSIRGTLAGIQQK